MSDWRIFTNKTGSSNKFWKFKYSEGGAAVEKEWGRIGGHIDSQTKSFGSHSGAVRYVEGEISKKLRKGYVEEDRDALKEQTEVAQTIGTRWKINRMEFLRPGDIDAADSGTLTLDFGKDYDANAGVFVEMLESWTKEKYWLLINKTNAFQFNGASYHNGSAVLTGKSYSVTSQFVLGVRKSIKSLFQAVEQALVKFGAVGTRVLDLGFDNDEEEAAPRQQAFLKIATATGVSQQVVEKFAAIGMRQLEI